MIKFDTSLPRYKRFQMFNLDTPIEAGVVKFFVNNAGRHYSSKETNWWAIPRTGDLNPRQLRRLIEHLRQAHHVPTCGTPSEGYWWPASLEDAAHCRNYFRSMITNFWKSAKGIEQGLQILYGRERLFGEEK